MTIIKTDFHRLRAAQERAMAERAASAHARLAHCNLAAMHDRAALGSRA